MLTKRYEIAEQRQRRQKMPQIRRLPIVGVMGSGSRDHAERAVPIGEWLARLGVHLLTGGGGGVMEAVSGAFHKVQNRKGLVIGIIPGDGKARGTPKSGYPNSWVEIPIYTHLPLSGKKGADPMSRNHLNILTSDVLIALPGSEGTSSEVALALHYQRPLVAYLSSREQIKNLSAEAYVTNDLEEVKEFVLSQMGGGRNGAY
jgi:uncharacterized protein (TIGR00725 family)